MKERKKKTRTQNCEESTGIPRQTDCKYYEVNDSVVVSSNPAACAKRGSCEREYIQSET